VVTVPQSRGAKSDERDAFHLAEQLRTGAVKNWVFKEPGAYRTLRELGRTHAMLVQDVVRVQNRIKALYRSRGVAVAGTSVYSENNRNEYLAKLPDATRAATETLYAQYDAVERMATARPVFRSDGRRDRRRCPRASGSRSRSRHTSRSPRNGAFAPFVPPTPQSDPWRHDRARIVS
jgi:hypothetical protein